MAIVTSRQQSRAAGTAHTFRLFGIALGFGLMALAGCDGGGSSDSGGNSERSDAVTQSVYVNNTSKDVYMYDPKDVTQNHGSILVSAHTTQTVNETYASEPNSGTTVTVTKHLQSVDGSITTAVTVNNVPIAGGKTEVITTAWDGNTLSCTAGAHPQ